MSKAPARSVVATRGRLLMSAIMLFVVFGCSDDASNEPNYLVGRGIGDITGPTVDVPLWGFQRPEQVANGVHTRLRARAFIIGEVDGDKRLVFVTTELGSMSHEIRLSVVENLQARYGELYTLDNVVLSATHTHAGPTGYHHFLSQTTFYQPHFDAVVGGITKAIEAAHEDLSPGRIFVGQGPVEGGGANRSLPAYLNNPVAEQARYEKDTDKEMTLLRFERADGVVGVLNWFAVHPTSLTFNNTLVSGDHKGFASFEMEQQMRGREAAVEDFVAAFAQSNAGDVTSNLNLDNTGPGVDDFDSSQIIGERQLDVAMALFDSASEALKGGVDYRLAMVNMPDLEVRNEFTGVGPQRTCPPAFGYAFGAGSTEDGGGNPLFMEGMLEQDPEIDALLRTVITSLPLPPVTEALLACHAPKPVLFPTGNTDPVPVGIAKLGQIALVFMPGEATTMAGRRLRDTVNAVFGDTVKYVVIAGYANEYAGYITTPEEYVTQQYEGGHTLFGRWTLPGYQQEIDRLARALMDGSPASSSLERIDLRGTVSSAAFGNDHDEPPSGSAFGEVLVAPEAAYAAGDQMSVSFWTGHPHNSFRQGVQYVEIQRRVDSGWSTVATESDWSTKVRWIQPGRPPPAAPLDPFVPPAPPIVDPFDVTITWEIPDDVEAGTYRVLFNGSEKPEGSDETLSFTAESPSFEVTRSSASDQTTHTWLQFLCSPCESQLDAVGAC